MVCAVYFLCHTLSSCQSQSIPALDLYTLQVTDSFKIRKLAQNDEISQYFKIRSKVVFYSRDSVCIGIYNVKDSSVKRVYFLPEGMQYVKGFNPFVINFELWNDSTVLVAYESRWPYVEDKIFLLNLNNLKLSHPFYSTDSNFISKYDTSIHSFNEAYQARNTWFAVANYSLPIRKSDTTVFMPVYNGDLVNHYDGQYRPLKNCIIPISTQFRKTKLDSMDITFSKVNSIFNDSIITSDDFYTLTRCRTTTITDSTFIVTFSGSKHLVEYNFNSRKTKVNLLELPLSEHSDLLMNKSSTKLSDILKFTSMRGNSKSKYFYRALNVPTKVNEKSPPDYREFLYDRQFKMIGAFNLRLFQKCIRGIEDDVLISFDKSRSIQDSNWMYFYKYKIMKTNEKCPQDSFLSVKLDGDEISPYKIQNYLNDLKLLDQDLDTIPFLISNNYCPTCVVKIGEFIKTIQTLNYSFKPFILHTENKEAYAHFKSDFQIRNDSLIYIDTLNNFSRLDKKVEIGLLLKQSEGNYYFKSFKVDELEELLAYICPKVRIVKGFCVPVEGSR